MVINVGSNLDHDYDNNAGDKKHVFSPRSDCAEIRSNKNDC